MKKFIKLCRNYLKENVSETTCIHSLGVEKFALKLAATEKLDRERKFIVRVAALLHDVAKDSASFEEHAKAGAKIFLNLAGDNMNGSDAKRIAHCIEAHLASWSGRGPKAKTIEAKIVSDADMLQQLGPFGLVKHMEKHNSKLFNERIIETEKDLIKAFNVLLTPSARKLGSKRIKYVRNFINKALQGY